MSVSLYRIAGDDLDVANGARASLNVEHQALTEHDRGLIYRLVRDGHTEPLRGVWAKFRITCSVKIARQIMTHKRYLAINERSTRYSEFDDEFVFPPMQRQVGKAMDYTYEPMPLSEHAAWTRKAREKYAVDHAFYTEALTVMSREDAAYFLPMGTETALIVSGDLVGWLRFLARRAHPHAQQEIRTIAVEIEGHLRGALPVTLAAWDTTGRKAL